MLLDKLAGAPDGVLAAEVRGNSSVYRGQRLPYYERALQANRMTVPLDVRRALGGASPSSPSSSSSGFLFLPLTAY